MKIHTNVSVKDTDSLVTGWGPDPQLLEQWEALNKWLIETDARMRGKTQEVNPVMEKEEVYDI